MDFVNVGRYGVKVPLGPFSRRSGRYTLASFGRQRGDPPWKEHAPMADLAYAVLLLGGFGVLILTLRGSEKL